VDDNFGCLEALDLATLEQQVFFLLVFISCHFSPLNGGKQKQEISMTCGRTISISMSGDGCMVPGQLTLVVQKTMREREEIFLCLFLLMLFD
jgi:hypothetical protein